MISVSHLVRTNYKKKRLFYQGIKEWNLLEQSFKDIDSFLILSNVSKSVFLTFVFSIFKIFVIFKSFVGF